MNSVPMTLGQEVGNRLATGALAKRYPNQPRKAPTGTSQNKGSIAKVAAFTKSRTLSRVATALRLNDFNFKIPTPGIYWIGARKRR